LAVGTWEHYLIDKYLSIWAENCTNNKSDWRLQYLHCITRWNTSQWRRPADRDGVRVHTIAWKGRDAGEQREAGVGFAIKTSLVRQLDTLLKGVSDRIMTLRIPLKAGNITFISVYALTMTKMDEIKDNFYAELNNIIVEVPKTDKLVMLGEFNARVCQDHNIWPGIISKNNTGGQNSNRLRLLSLCATNQLIITNTVFQQSTKFKTTWQHPRSGHWHMIDHVITRQRDLSDITITSAMWRSKCNINHWLIRSRMRIHERPKRSRGVQPTTQVKRLNISQLQNNKTEDVLKD